MGLIELISAGGVVILVALVAIAAMLYVATNLLYICEPNEVLIFSGGWNKGGYRVVKGGRSLRTPLFERVDRLDLTNMVIDLGVSGAYSKGGIPLTVQGVANLKIAGHDPKLANAVERLLGKDRKEVVRIAKDVLEGTLRGVLAGLTPEEVNNDKLAFASKLLAEAEQDLHRLGLVLDNMKIQNVSDDRGYLNSIGRRSSAEIIKHSRIAEAKAKAAALIRDASNRERARLTEIASEEQIARAEADRRIADAESLAKSRIAEEVGRIEAAIARATAALEAEEARVEETRQRLSADVIAPARADMNAGIAEAKGRAARILEEGRATVDVLKEMIAVWKEAGDSARDIFLMQKLQTIMQSLVSTLGDVRVDRVTMLPDYGPDMQQSTARTAVRVVEELKGAIGVDLPKLLEQAASKS